MCEGLVLIGEESIFSKRVRYVSITSFSLDDPLIFIDVILPSLFVNEYVWSIFSPEVFILGS